MGWEIKTDIRDQAKHVSMEIKSENKKIILVNFLYFFGLKSYNARWNQLC